MLDLIREEQTNTTLQLSQIRTDGGTQMRAGLNNETVDEYAAAMDEAEGWGNFKPITVFHDGANYWLSDGFHRIAAWQQTGLYGDIPAEVRSGTRRDAILHAAGANADHGLRRTNADKRRAVEMLLSDREWSQWSDREIARRCKVSDRFVNNLRSGMQSYTANGSQYERTFVHPKTGEPTTMRTAKIGANRPPSIPVPIARVVGKCKVCGAALTDPTSVSEACGPRCAAKLAARMGPEPERNDLPGGTAVGIGPLDEDNDAPGGGSPLGASLADVETLRAKPVESAGADDEIAIVERAILEWARQTGMGRFSIMVDLKTDKPLWKVDGWNPGYAFEDGASSLSEAIKR